MEKKIFKGGIVGSLAIVLALTIWVININDTYSADTSQKCKVLNGIEYKYVSNATKDVYGCCPVSDSAGGARLGSFGGSDNHCFTYTYSDGSCPDGYSVYNEGNCIADVGEIDNSACYICSGTSVTGSNYMWTESTPTATCNGGTWTKSTAITNEESCKSGNQSYEVTFDVNNGQTSGGKLYQNGVFKSRNVISLSSVNYSNFTAEYSDNSGNTYVFSGWDTSRSCNSPQKSGVKKLTGKLTLYACYSRKIDTVNLYKVYLNASSKDGINGVVYENSTSKNVQEHTINNIEENTTFDLSKYSGKITGYTFTGWSASNTCNNIVQNYKITGDKRFYACYSKNEEKTYSVTLNGSGGIVYENNTSTNKSEYVRSIEQNLYINLSRYSAKKSGYTFVGWSVSNTCSSFISNYKVTSDKKFYACFEKEGQETKTYKVTFDPKDGTWVDGTSGKKVKEYTSRKYFTDEDILIKKDGYTFKGWKNTAGDVFSIYVDASDNNSVLIPVWKSNNSSGGGTSPDPGIEPDPDIGDEETCEYISKDSCEIFYEGFSCVKDKNNCYVKNNPIDDENKCDYELKSDCENSNSGYLCEIDSNGCYIKGDKKSASDDKPVSNPNTGNSLIYFAIIIAIGSLVYTIFYTYKLKRKESD